MTKGFLNTKIIRTAFILFILAQNAFFPVILCAQNRNLKIGYVYPAGGKTGDTIEVVVGGMGFNGLERAFISGNSVSVESVKPFNPFKNFSNDLKNELRPIVMAMEKGEDPVEASADNSRKILEKIKKQSEANPRQATTAKQDHDSMQNINPGEKLIYIDMTPQEVVEKLKAMSPLEYQCLCKEIFSKPNPLQASPAIAQMAILKIKIGKDAEPGVRELRLESNAGISNPINFCVDDMPEISENYFVPENKNTKKRLEFFPIILNGQIMPGEIDKASFSAKTGDKFVFSLKGRALIPFLGDAVPGWFQAILSVHDDKGRLIAYADDNFYNPDPVLEFVAPASGEYSLHIRDSIYRGREDFIYRIKCEKGILYKGLETARMPFFESLQQIPENENNNESDHAEPVAFPCLVSGTISSPKDCDFFSAKFAKGKKVVVETFARRLGYPTDTILRIFSPEGKLVAWNDDSRNLNVGTTTHHADSFCIFEAAEEGEYKIMVSEAQRKGGEEFKYFLRIDIPRPDFSAYVFPSAINARSGTFVPFKVALERKEGLDGEVEIKLKEAPAGMSVAGSRIPAETNEIWATFFVPANLALGSHKIRLTAVSKSTCGAEIEREVVPCDEVMQAFIYYHLLPASETIVHVIRKGGMPSVKVPEKIELKAGEESEIIFKCPTIANGKWRFSIDLFSPPDGVKILKSDVNGENYTVTLFCEKEAKPWRGNMIFECYPEQSPDRKNQPSRWLIGALPAIPAEILSK